MIKHKILLAVALCSAMVALPDASARERRPLGSSWADVARIPDLFSGNWQSTTTFLDFTNNTPLTPQAQAHAAQFRAIEDIPFAGPGCPTPGMPIVQRLGSPLKFFYEPGMIAIYIENSSMTRFIRLNGTHAERPNPSYLGDSIAHFEDDTLVVDSIGFAEDMQIQYTNFPGRGVATDQPGFAMVLPPDSVFGPHGPNMRIVERFQLRDPDTLELQTTIYDDTVWTAPYVATVHIFKRNRGEAGIPREWVCGSAPDPLNFDGNATVMEDPAEVLRRIQQNDRR